LNLPAIVKKLLTLLLKYIYAMLNKFVCKIRPIIYTFSLDITHTVNHCNVSATGSFLFSLLCFGKRQVFTDENYDWYLVCSFSDIYIKT